MVKRSIIPVAWGTLPNGVRWPTDKALEAAAMSAQEFRRVSLSYYGANPIRSPARCVNQFFADNEGLFG